MKVKPGTIVQEGELCTLVKKTGQTTLHVGERSTCKQQ